MCLCVLACVVRHVRIGLSVVARCRLQLTEKDEIQMSRLWHITTCSSVV